MYIWRHLLSCYPSGWTVPVVWALSQYLVRMWEWSPWNSLHLSFFTFSNLNYFISYHLLGFLNHLCFPISVTLISYHILGFLNHLLVITSQLVLKSQWFLFSSQCGPTIFIQPHCSSPASWWCLSQFFHNFQEFLRLYHTSLPPSSSSYFDIGLHTCTIKKTYWFCP